MNTQTNDGGPAFPITQLILAADGSVERVVISPGMTLRDYFAGKALEGIIAGSSIPLFNNEGGNEGQIRETAQMAVLNGPGPANGEGIHNSIGATWSWVSYAIADAMLSARERKGDA